MRGSWKYKKFARLKCTKKNLERVKASNLFNDICEIVKKGERSIEKCNLGECADNQHIEKIKKKIAARGVWAERWFLQMHAANGKLMRFFPKELF